MKIAERGALALQPGTRARPIGAVSLGTPHFQWTVRPLMPLLNGGAANRHLYQLGRATLDETPQAADEEGRFAPAAVTWVEDPCVYVSALTKMETGDHDQLRQMRLFKRRRTSGWRSATARLPKRGLGAGGNVVGL